MKIAFRVDASSSIGSGHVYRCLVLANKLKSRGHTCIFIARDHPGNLNQLISSRGFKVFILDNPNHLNNKRINLSLFHESWLEVPYELDKDQTIEVCRDLDLDLIIVDHYAIDYRWESKLRPYCKKIFVIDDLADRVHDCDYLLDQNFPSDLGNRYKEANLIPINTVTIFGPKYALLHDDYEKYKSAAIPRDENVSDILIFFGGADVDNLTELTVKAILTIFQNEVNVHVVVSHAYANFESLENLSLNQSNIFLYKNLDSLGKLILLSDIAIGGGGVNSWERCCLGLPSIIISIAENQIPIAKFLEKNNCAIYLGHKSEIDFSTLVNLLKMNFSKKISHSMSLSALNLVDGKGANRVVDILEFDLKKNVFHAIPLSRTVAQLSQYNELGSLAKKKWMGSALNLFKAIRNPDFYEGYQLLLNNEVTVGIIHFFRQSEGCWSVEFEQDLNFPMTLPDNRKFKSAIVGFRKKRGELIGFECVDLNKKNLPSITICTDLDSWINYYVPDLIILLINQGYTVYWSHRLEELIGGDICFYLAFKKKVGQTIFSHYKTNVVIHESDLPCGKGWSPMTYSILNGENSIVISMIEMVDEIDSGDIYMKDTIELSGYELSDQWRDILGKKTIDMCHSFILSYPGILKNAKKQTGQESFYPRRGPEDSKLNVQDTIQNQFNLLRVVDNSNYPAFFEINGRRYFINIRSSDG